MNNYNVPYCASGMPRGTNAMQSRNVRVDSDTDCACCKSRFPVNTSYAMAYVPFQQSGEVYPCERALARGTAFPCLDLPFLKGCCK